MHNQSQLDLGLGYAASRETAIQNALAVFEQMQPRGTLTREAFRMLCGQSLAGLATAQLPDNNALAGLTSIQREHALDELFNQGMAAWKTTRGWIYAREPVNPETQRRLSAKASMTEKALLEYKEDLYQLYFLANDFATPEGRQKIYYKPQWSAHMLKQVAPSPRPVSRPRSP